jgi:hypothetical protein
MVLLSAQAMDVPQIARVTFTSEDRVRDVLHTETTQALWPSASPPMMTADAQPFAIAEGIFL